ncbi:ScbR family autoregulator-binding transcription factor [Saccharothrix obliqua]|uniref:ScbR family autoregulator-binding transcription factor n=1 Tax=Saccharothrix obliqua TaxID=2861747 RepID=UPI001C5F4E2C|nr:ScbR family autoregulator-binding transcription factor [Saccharothrix obliqua]MBW4715779.1 TetR/AcrR family transcriptional regulator [Saccharothrix obliqua]
MPHRTPQQPRAHATRQAILRAAAEEFDRLGYAGAPLSAILDRSGVTKGAFYFHFPSKAALASAIARAQDDVWPVLTRAWRDRGLDPLRTLVGLLEEAAARLSDDVVLRAGVRITADREFGHVGLATSHLRWEAVLVDLLDAARAAGQLRRGVDPRGAARTLTAAVLGARLIATATTRCADYPDRVREMWRFVLPGIATDEWCAEAIARPAVL